MTVGVDIVVGRQRENSFSEVRTVPVSDPSFSPRWSILVALDVFGDLKSPRGKRGHGVDADLIVVAFV